MGCFPRKQRGVGVFTSKQRTKGRARVCQVDMLGLVAVRMRGAASVRSISRLKCVEQNRVAFNAMGENKEQSLSLCVCVCI